MAPDSASHDAVNNRWGTVPTDIILHVLDKVVTDDIEGFPELPLYYFFGKHNLLWAVRLAHIVSTIGQVCKTWSIAASSHTMWYNACKTLAVKGYQIDLNLDNSNADSFHTLFVKVFRSECTLCHIVRFMGSPQTVHPAHMLSPSKYFGHLPYCAKHDSVSSPPIFCGTCFSRFTTPSNQQCFVDAPATNPSQFVCNNCYVQHMMKYLHRFGLDPKIKPQNGQALFSDIVGQLSSARTVPEKIARLQRVVRRCKWYAQLAEYFSEENHRGYDMTIEQRSAMDRKWARRRLSEGNWTHPDEEFDIRIEHDADEVWSGSSSRSANAAPGLPPPPLDHLVWMTSDYVALFERHVFRAMQEIVIRIGVDTAMAKKLDQIIALLVDWDKRRGTSGPLIPFGWVTPKERIIPQGITHQFIRKLWLRAVTGDGWESDERLLRDTTKRQRLEADGNGRWKRIRAMSYEV